MDLAELLQDGSEDAFATIYEQFRSDGLRIAVSVTKCLDAAEDVYQTSMMRIWRNRKKFRGDSKFSTYAYRAIRNAGLDYLRSQRRLNKLRDKIKSGIPTHEKEEKRALAIQRLEVDAYSIYGR
jgi:RNA polymerase sigma factor (sigma-70 family)